MTLSTVTIQEADGGQQEVIVDNVADQLYPVYKLAVGAAGSANLISSDNPVPVSVGNTVTVSVGNTPSVSTTPADSGYLDAFGRQRTSSTGQRFDCEFIYDKQLSLIDEVVAGGGSATHNANARDVVLAVVDANANTKAELYSHYDVPYTAGNSQLVDITGTLDNAAIGGGTAQLFIRSSVTGSVVETVYAQTAWNQNTASDVNWTKSQILVMDFQSLKIGRIRFFLVRNGVPVHLHSIYNDNLRATGYWQSPSLPPFWRIYNDATPTYTYCEMGYGDASNAIGIRYRLAVNASATMRAICATVKSEGGAALLDIPGYNRSADNGTTAVAVSTALLPVLSIRPAATLNSIVNRGLYIPESYSVQSDNPIRYVLLYRPSLTGPSWTAVNATHSGMEYDVSASAVSGGIVVESDYLSTGRNQVSKTQGLLGRTLLSLGRTGTADILTLAAIRNSGSNAAVFGSLRWKEIR